MHLREAVRLIISFFRSQIHLGLKTINIAFYLTLRDHSYVYIVKLALKDSRRIDHGFKMVEDFSEREREMRYT